ncbi:MAG: hypothetical protein KDD77_11450, partial [Caldilineaceae bacterium]|nr:hypothetical protein [Caldilineaceae bacterium]
AADGFPVSALACVGGGARSALWNQIKADVLDRPVTLPGAASGAAMGDAIVAAAGAGLYPSIEAAVAGMVTTGPSYQPDPARARVYDDFYRIYRDLYPALRASFRDLAEVRA